MKNTISQKYSLNENTISQKYTDYVAILKYKESTKFQTTTMCDISLDSPLKVKYTLKISSLYLLPSSRKLIVNTLLKHVEITKF